MLLLRRSSAGRIVNIASMAYRGNVGQTNYAAAKAGLVGLTRSLGLERTPRHHGELRGACGSNRDAESPSFFCRSVVRERLIRTTPMRRMGTIDDIAHAVLFFASDLAAFTSRQVLHVSGGMEGF